MDNYHDTIKRFLNLMESLYVEEKRKPSFDPKAIYRTYFAIYLGQRYDDEESMEVIESVAGDLREYYLEQYMDVVKDQLEKYYNRGRISKKFDPKLINSDRFNVLHKLMDETFRSDMKRKNDRWLQLTSHLKDLQDDIFENPVDMLLKMDRINNLVHNTGEVMLTKFQNARELLKALEKSSSRDTEPREFKSLAQDRTLNKLAISFGEEKNV